MSQHGQTPFDTKHDCKRDCKRVTEVEQISGQGRAILWGLELRAGNVSRACRDKHRQDQAGNTVQA